MARPFFIRFASGSERGALEELQHRASLANDGDRVALLANPEAIVLPPEQFDASQVLLAEHEGIAIGFAVVFAREDGDVELDGLFVDPLLWRKGVGRALVQECATQAFLNGAKALHLVANPHAMKFYEACAFKAYGTVETQLGSAVLMRLAL